MFHYPLRNLQRRPALPALALLSVLVLLLGLALPSPVYAHAYLERSTPAGNTVVETSPRQVQIWFTERPELRFSDVTVYTAEGQQVPRGPLTLAPDNPRSVVFELEPLPDGTYTVAWRTLSIDDGHPAVGAFAFAVGLDQPPPTAASIFIPAGQIDDSGRPTPLQVLARWLAYGGAALAVGTPLFLLLVVWPALRGARRPGHAGVPLEPAAADRLTQLHTTGLVLAAAAAVAGLLGQAVAVSGDSAAALRGAVLDLLTTRSGVFFWVRLAALALLLVAARQMARRGWAERRDWPLGLALVAALALLGAQVMVSHAAATPIWNEFTLAVGTVHLAAMAAWIGGLVLLLAFVPVLVEERPEHERAPLLTSLVSRFSGVALWSVGVLVLSGLYQSWVHVGSSDGLTATGYGVTLLVKLALVVPLVLIGALNLLLVKPGLAAAARASAHRATQKAGSFVGSLLLAVRGEVAIGTAVLLATAVLANTPPARDALLQQGLAQTRSATVDGLRLTLTVDPAVAGLNTYDLAIADSASRPVEDAQRVALRFRHTEHDMGEIEAVLQPRGDGHYTTQGSYLSMAGLWQVDVRVRRPGQGDLAAALEIPAADPSAAALGRQAQVPSLGTTFLAGLQLILLGVLLAVGARRLRLPLRRPLNLLVPRLSAVALGLAGLYLLSQGVMTDLTPTAALANPIPPTRASLERGAEIYRENCATCHGESGRGDGPTGRLLRPRPADLQQHVTEHTEGQLFWWVSRGVPGTAMPAWEDSLSEEDRWHVINYIVQAFRPSTANPASPER